ncbi:MAG: hypothetical protein IPI53_01175 [Saprospiraceae bacterium]|nr:hypothetical protein [Saprospiraceae bacterium]
MTPLQEMIFIGEIVLQSKILFKANDRLSAALEANDQIEIWSSLQSVLVASGNISKILWPSKKYADRGASLRKILKIENNNPLSSRTFRNHFEHYDERIEEWFLLHQVGSYIDLSTNPSLMRSFPRSDHRGYNSFNNTLKFRDEILDLNEIITVVQQIYQNCRPYTLM